MAQSKMHRDDKAQDRRDRKQRETARRIMVETAKRQEQATTDHKGGK